MENRERLAPVARGAGPWESEGGAGVAGAELPKAPSQSSGLIPWLQHFRLLLQAFLLPSPGGKAVPELFFPLGRQGPRHLLAQHTGTRVYQALLTASRGVRWDEFPTCLLPPVTPAHGLASEEGRKQLGLPWRLGSLLPHLLQSDVFAPAELC